MSLFCSYEWWSTQCDGKFEDKSNESQNEEIDFHSGSLLVTDLIQGSLPIILIGNHAGTLWGYKPTSSNSPQDLLFEYNFGKAILALGSGNLLLGSQEKHLVVLHHTQVNIYSLHESFGNATHGQQFYLEPMYTINFQFLAYSIVIGSFGYGVNKSAEKSEKDKSGLSKSAQDSVCVQAMDGSLHFFENDLNVLCMPSKNEHKGSQHSKLEKISKEIKVDSATGKSKRFTFNDNAGSENMPDVTQAEVHDCPPDDSSAKRSNFMAKGFSSMDTREFPESIPEEKEIQQLGIEENITENPESSVHLSKPKFTFSPFQDVSLPNLFCYMPPEDCFIIFSGSWTINCYRYATLELQQMGARKKKSIFPEWSYVFGEPILSLSYLEGCIFALGTRGTLVSLNQFGVARFCKKLCFCPSAFCAFAADGKLMLLVSSEDGTLMVYDGGPIISSNSNSQLYPLPSTSTPSSGRLVWSAKLPFPPIAIARGSFEELSGLVIILSDQGHLQCCHLGTTPRNFNDLPMARIGPNKFQVEKEEEKKKVEHQPLNETALTPIAMSLERSQLHIELIINFAKLMPNNMNGSWLAQSQGNAVGEKTNDNLCSAEVDVSLVLVPTVPLSCVCISASIDRPLRVLLEKKFIETLSEEVRISLQISGSYNTSSCFDAIPNLFMDVVVTCFGGYTGTAEGLPLLVFHTSVNLPMSIVFSQDLFYDTELKGDQEVSQQEKSFEFAFHGYKSPNLDTLFPEFNISLIDNKSSKLDLYLYGHHLKRIQITRKCIEERNEEKSIDCIYTIVSSCLLPLYFMSHLLYQRIENYICELESQISGNGGKQRGKLFQLTLRTPLPIEDLLEAVDDHCSARNKFAQHRVSVLMLATNFSLFWLPFMFIRNPHFDLGCVSNQLSMAECSVLTKVRDPKPLMFSEELLDPLFDKVCSAIKCLEDSQQGLIIRTKKLKTLIELVMHLQPEMLGNSSLKVVTKAISVELEDSLQQGWEERTEACLSYLLTGQIKTNKEHYNDNELNLTNQNSLFIHSLKQEIAELLNKLIYTDKRKHAVQSQ